MGAREGLLAQYRETPAGSGQRQHPNENGHVEHNQGVRIAALAQGGS